MERKDPDCKIWMSKAVVESEVGYQFRVLGFRGLGYRGLRV